ncbi:MAG: riboflavin synthase, partial [Gemmatimonadales bacterium]
MFTGIVSAVGRIEAISPNGGRGTGDGGRVLRIRAPYRGLKKGESIAVNGACLTVEKVARGSFTVHAVQTTLGRTLIGAWRKGGTVN